MNTPVATEVEKEYAEFSAWFRQRQKEANEYAAIVKSTPVDLSPHFYFMWTAWAAKSGCLPHVRGR